MKLYSFLYQPQVKKHLTIILTGFLLGALLYLFVSYTADRKGVILILSGLDGILLAYLVLYIMKWLNTSIPWKKQLGFRLFSGVFIVAITLFLMAWGSIYLFWLINQEASFLELHGELLLKLGILLFTASLLFNIIYFAVYSYNHYVRGQLMNLQLERKQTELQLSALKSQLSPHFLFNSVNAISSLVYTDIEKAETFVRKLALLYEFILNNYENKLITVKDELSFVKSYLFLLRTRLGDETIDFNVALPEEVLQTKIPPLTLQILVENAVKHNQVSTSKKLKINIDVSEQKIRVSNTKTSPPKQVTSFKIGLKNIVSRYQVLANKKIKIVNDDQFTVYLPYIE